MAMTQAAMTQVDGRKKGHDRHATWCIYGFLAAAVGASRGIYSDWLLLGDAILAITVAVTVGRGTYRWRASARTLLEGTLGLLLLIFGLSTFVNLLGPGFSHIEFVKSALKLSLYLLGMFCFIAVARDAGYERVAHCLKRLLRALLVLSIAQQIAFQVGYSVGLLATYGGPFDRASFPRSPSAFNEPALLAMFVVASAMFLYAAKRFTTGDGLVCLLLLAFAASLAGAALLVIAVGSVTVAGLRAPQLVRLMVGFLFLLVLTQVPPVDQVFRDRVVERVQNTLSGGRQDASGQGRLGDGWIIAGYVMDNGQPLLGVGTGQIEVELRRIGQADDAPELDSRVFTSGGVWNIFATVTIEAGLLGFVAIVVCVVDRCRRWWPAVLVLAAIGFSTGTFFGSMWWYSYTLLGMASTAASVRPAFVAATGRLEPRVASV